MDEIDVLPDYMQIAYKFIMTIFQEYQHEAAKQDKLFAVPCFIETVCPTFHFQFQFQFPSLLYVTHFGMFPYTRVFKEFYENFKM